MISARPLTVVILTYNEEDNLPRALSSIPEDWEILVVDSGSTDATLKIAEKRGANIAQTGPFTHFAVQRNFARQGVLTPWMLFLDADEWMSPKLVASIREAIKNVEFDGYRLRRRLVFMGRALRFGKAYDAPLRLARTDKAVYVGKIHETMLVSGKVGKLKGEMLHYSYRDLTDYFARFNRYTSRVAEEHLQLRVPLSRWHYLRPWLEFFSRYILRLGCLDGAPGYTYALLSSVYAYVKYEKMREVLVLKKDHYPIWVEKK
jgi:glycosyltransferase involved in cell wall biosynthesis